VNHAVNHKHGQAPALQTRRFRIDCKNGWPPFSTMAHAVSYKKGINFKWHDQGKTFQIIVNSQQEYACAMSMVYRVCKEAELDVHDDTVPFDKAKDFAYLYIDVHKVDKVEAREGLVPSAYGATYFLKSFLGCSQLCSVRRGGFDRETDTWHGLRHGCLEELLSLAMAAGLRVVGAAVDGHTLDPWQRYSLVATHEEPEDLIAGIQQGVRQPGW
jgi:hypothetical protein